MILERAAEVRLSLADLSRKLGKNDAYLQQFIWRGSPRKLPDTARNSLAAALQVPASLLTDGASLTGVLPAPSFRRVIGDDEMPVFTEGGIFDPDQASHWTTKPLAIPLGLGCFAVWVRRDNGRVKPGDLLFACQNQPPRHDDVAVLVKDKAIIAVGNIDSLENDSVVVAGTHHAMDGVSAYKVAAVKFA